MKAKRFAVILFLLCLLPLVSAGKRAVKIRVSADNFTLEKEYALSEDIPLIKRWFIFDYGKFAARLKENGLSDREALEVMFSGLTRDVDELCKSCYVAPSDATVIFRPSDKNKFIFTAEKDGCEVNGDKIFADIIKELDGKKIDITAEFTVIKPQITQNDLKNNTVKRGNFQTYYGASTVSRKENIERAASFINGTRIPSGEVFSFNKTVGARTAERGYKEAPIIVDGKFVGGVGGGVCQVSTTLYNAALYSDLQITSVNRHSLPVRYVKPSFDAMVSSISDLRFRNNTAYDIFLAASCADGNLIITVYGAPKEFEIVLESSSVTVERETEYITDETLSCGEEKVVTEGADGVSSTGYLIRLKDGVEIGREIIRRDNYKAVNRVVAKGVDKAEENVPLPK